LNSKNRKIFWVYAHLTLRRCCRT